MGFRQCNHYISFAIGMLRRDDIGDVPCYAAYITAKCMFKRMRVLWNINMKYSILFPWKCSFFRFLRKMTQQKIETEQ